MEDAPEITVRYIDPGEKSFIIGWCSPLWGFGEMTLYFDEHNKFKIDTEYMGAAFAKVLLTALVDTINKNGGIR